MRSSGTIVALFDDGQSRFGPLGDLRASFEQRLGVLTCIERTKLVLGRVDALLPPEYLAAVVTERQAGGQVLVGRLPAGAQEVILINGALDCLEDAADLSSGETILSSNGRVAMGRWPLSMAQSFIDRLATNDRHPPKTPIRAMAHGQIIAEPWGLLERLAQSIPADITLLSRSGEMTDRVAVGVQRFGNHPLLMDPTARVFPGAIIDTTEGPVLLAHGATVSPGAVVCGPVAVLENSSVMVRAHIKARTVIGPECKVGGEVGSTVFQGCSNKAHEGHLADALVGEWVNLGAGTCNSNLMNTYGEVTTRLDASGSIERTNRVFYGCIIADHAKCAILVAINTGSTIGTGAMIAVARPATFVDRFAWLTSERAQFYRFDRFETALAAVMARRGKVPGEAYTARLRALHEAHANRGIRG
ncbi:MAG: hypothetical protein EXS17_05665 [Phycisphaerales bacterium]|nr:hypothetical protein [Phycisphaerales bacterium]